MNKIWYNYILPTNLGILKDIVETERFLPLAQNTSATPTMFDSEKISVNIILWIVIKHMIICAGTNMHGDMH